MSLFNDYTVKVTTNSKKDVVTEPTPRTLRVSTKQKPINGLANEAVIALVADFLSVPEKQIVIIKGHSASSKILRVYLN